MLLQHQGLPRSSKLKGIVRPVERGIEAMDRPMVIRTHKHEVGKGIRAAPRDPVDMMRLADVAAVCLTG